MCTCFASQQTYFANKSYVVFLSFSLIGEAIHLMVQVLVPLGISVQHQHLQFIVKLVTTVLEVATHLLYHASRDRTVMLKA